MNNKKIFVTILCIIIVIFVFVFFINKSNKSLWVCTENGWVNSGKQSNERPNALCGKNDIQETVLNYLKNNISNISPEKEVLGGKFYINKIDWVGDNSGIVEYEDGHILLKASFDFKVATNTNDSSSSVVINNYKIIK